jgi:hypothetical protein
MQVHGRRRRSTVGRVVLRGADVKQDHRCGRCRVRPRWRGAEASRKGAVTEAMGAVHSPRCLRRVPLEAYRKRVSDESLLHGVFGI